MVSVQAKIFIGMIIVMTVFFGILPTIFVSLNVPELATAHEWIQSFAGVELTWPGIFFFFILPYIGMSFILWGLFEEIGIFRRMNEGTRSIFYAIIAVCWTAALIPTGVLSFVALILFQGGAIVALGVFMGTFIGGAILWGLAFGSAKKGAWDELRKLQDQIRVVDEQLEKVAKDYAAGTISEDDYWKRRNALAVRRGQVRRRMSVLESSIEPGAQETRFKKKKL